MRRISENPTLRECKVGALFVMIRLYFKLGFIGALVICTFLPMSAEKYQKNAP